MSGGATVVRSSTDPRRWATVVKPLGSTARLIETLEQLQQAIDAGVRQQHPAVAQPDDPIRVAVAGGGQVGGQRTGERNLG